MALGEFLKEKRLYRCLTQKELSNLVGITVQTLCLHEKDKMIPSLKVLKKYGEVLKVKIEKLTILRNEQQENNRKIKKTNEQKNQNRDK
jgi:DNA-binding XRE family transcriptional regulator